jgi:hypothetical protein
VQLQLGGCHQADQRCLINQRAAAVYFDRLKMSVASAEVRPWDRLLLPDDIRQALFPAPAVVASAVVRPWDRLLLPDDIRVALIPSPDIAASAPAAPLFPAPSVIRQGVVGPLAESRPWDRLNLPEDIRLALIPSAPAFAVHNRLGAAFGAAHHQPWDRLALNDAAAPRRVRRRIACYCGQDHEHIDNSRHCNGVALGSALTIHRFCESNTSTSIPQHYLGSLFSQVCAHCQAGQFLSETLNCCAQGSAVVPLVEVPHDLHSVICSPPVAHHIRAYNMALAMASTGHQNLSPGWGMFVLGGKTYHRIAAPNDDPSRAPGFAQIYMLDTSEATSRRLDIFAARPGLPALDAAVLAQMHDLLLMHNPWVLEYRSAGSNPGPELRWHSCGHTDVTGMGLGSMLQGFGARCIVLRHNDGGITSIDDGHALYHPLAYVLLFPTGAAGWHDGLMRVNVRLEASARLSLTTWARFLMMRRVGGLSHLQSCGALTSEFWCDVWAQVESRKLGFLRRADSQSRIRSDRFCAVDDAITRRCELGQLGTPVWMPASFVGSAKW